MNRTLKVILAQLNPTVGDFSSNFRQAEKTIREAEASQADLVIFPELFITGYPPEDLIFEAHFVRKNMALIEELARMTGETVVIIGAVHHDGQDTYNGAAVLQHGKLLFWAHKSLLPTYDVFNEWRYFKPGRDNRPFEVTTRQGTVKLGVHICEDLWDQKIGYKIIDRLAEAGAELLINISASPFHALKDRERLELIQNKVRRFKIPYIYLNLVGGQDELVFDGASLVVDRAANLLHIGPKFGAVVETLQVPIDTEGEHHVALPNKRKEQEVFEGLVFGLTEYFRKTGHQDAVLGLSGGIDSALTAVLAKEALGSEHVLGVSMPSKYSTQHSRDDARVLAENLGIHYVELPIGGPHKAFSELFTEGFGKPLEGLAEENLQARIRGNILMGLSNRDGSLLLTTGNKTEVALGYCTLYGDTSGGLAVISDLSKTMVYALARHYNAMQGREIIPHNCITKPPSAELRPDQVDPFDYDTVSPLVDLIIEAQLSYAELVQHGYDETLVKEIMELICRSEYKRRQLPPGIRVTRRAFGIGRRMPIVNKYCPFDGDTDA
ncbi:MAG: NAD+ synthase [Lentisphaeria bacterium]|nr:NAD+ synthase [Lentisphaeria bacterium]